MDKQEQIQQYLLPEKTTASTNDCFLIFSKTKDAINSFNLNLTEMLKKQEEIYIKEQKEKNEQIKQNALYLKNKKIRTCICCGFVNDDDDDASELFAYIRTDNGDPLPYCNPYCKSLLDMVCMGCGIGYPFNLEVEKINGKSYCFNCASRKKNNKTDKKYMVGAIYLCKNKFSKNEVIGEFIQVLGDEFIIKDRYQRIKSLIISEYDITNLLY